MGLDKYGVKIVTDMTLTQRKTLPPTRLLRSVIRSPRWRVPAAACSFCWNQFYYLASAGKLYPPMEGAVGGHQPEEEGEREILLSSVCLVESFDVFKPVLE